MIAGRRAGYPWPNRRGKGLRPVDDRGRVGVQMLKVKLVLPRLTIRVVMVLVHGIAGNVVDIWSHRDAEAIRWKRVERDIPDPIFPIGEGHDGLHVRPKIRTAWVGQLNNVFGL